MFGKVSGIGLEIFVVFREMARAKEAEEKAKIEEAKKQKATKKVKVMRLEIYGHLTLIILILIIQVEKKPEMKRTERQLLGKFNKDVLFLEKFIADTSSTNVGETSLNFHRPSQFSPLLNKIVSE